MFVQVVTKVDFERNIDDILITNRQDLAFISILDNENNSIKYSSLHTNFICVKMWDIEEDLYENGILKYKKPEDQELQKIVNFVNLHKNTKGFIIHCSAGISRSGAVARFILDKFHHKINLEEFKIKNRHILPNLYILNRLKKLDAMIQNDEKLICEYTHIDYDKNNESKGKLIFTKSKHVHWLPRSKRYTYEYYIRTDNGSKTHLLFSTYNEKKALNFFKKARKNFDYESFSLKI